MTLFKKKNKEDQWWLDDEDRKFMASYRSNSRKRALIVFLIGIILFLASN